jgi:uncharacterized membrane protein YeaQ/YmgE (transglycosylase-associated protein family)
VQILLGILLGAVVGGLVHLIAPHRDTRGIALGPVAGAAAGGGVWTALTWAGLGVDNPLLWLAALVVPALVATPLLIGTAVSRARSDAATRARLQAR